DGEVAGEPRLLIGAQTGVMIVDPRDDAAGDVQIYTDSGVPSQLGFNSVTAIGDAIWASHGDAGVVAWHVGENSKPFFTSRPERGGADGPRNLTALDGSRLIYSAGAAVMSVKSDGSGAMAEVHAGATVIAIAALDRDQLMVV